MTEIVVLPHHEICPEGAVIEAEQGESVCEAPVSYTHLTLPDE